jgi:3-hydroxybutyryl-CoA dehydratase
MSIKFDLSNFHIGQNLPEKRKTIVQEEINLYAKASRDYNPIHIDEEFAKKTPLGGTIAHGMLVLAYISQAMADAFGQEWFTGGSLNVRFKAPARPGDVITIHGKIQKIQKETERTVIGCDVLCANQKNETVISGEAIVRIKNENIS